MVIESLGLDFPTKLIVPVYESYQGLSIVKIFLDNIFNSVMFFLSILCILLIYSLMLGNVDERNYEFGMLRALGYKKDSLKTLIVMQAVFFSIPAIILALIVCYIFNVVVSYFLFNYSGLTSTYQLNPNTIIWVI